MVSGQVSDDAATDGEVSLSGVKPIEEKGLNNGLGLESFIPGIDAKPQSKKITGVSKPDESSSDTDSKNKKETPTKDPKTGRFLPKSKESDLPIDDGAANDEPNTLKKRLKDTRDWASKVNKTNHELSAQVKKLQTEQEVLKRKLDGTYTEPEKPEIDQVEMAKLSERTKISRAIAEQVYGPDLVQEWIYNEDSPYRELEQADPYIKAKVFQAEQPVMEAIKQLKWKGFVDKYGSDPDQIVEKLHEEAKATFVQNLKQKDRKLKTVEDVGGLSDTTGNGPSSKSDGKADTVQLANIFSNFPTGHF